MLYSSRSNWYIFSSIGLEQIPNMLCSIELGVTLLGTDGGAFWPPLNDECELFYWINWLDLDLFLRMASLSCILSGDTLNYSRCDSFARCLFWAEIGKTIRSLFNRFYAARSDACGVITSVKQLYVTLFGWLYLFSLSKMYLLVCSLSKYLPIACDFRNPLIEFFSMN